MRVVVLGATGVVGTALVPELAKDHDVVAISRRPSTRGGPVEWQRADALDERTLEGPFRSADVVVHLVHSLGTEAFEDADRRAAGNVARAADRAGVGQIVYLGGLGDESSGLSLHLRSRSETATVLGSGSTPLTTLRAAMVVGAGSAAFETVRALVDRLPVMVCPRWVTVPTQPIALRDVVAYLAGVVGVSESFGTAYDIGGPEVMTYREMIERIARIRGKRPRIVEVPVLTPRLSSWWLHLVTPVNAAVARPLIEGLRSPTVVRDDRIRELVRLELTSFDDAVRAALRPPGNVPVRKRTGEEPEPGALRRGKVPDLGEKTPSS
jgi:uncharacterized protein YbjT (DUF2867 family)